MHYRKGELVQVHTKKEGGTRNDITKDPKKQGFIEKAGQLFFPGGKNAEGSLTDFELDLTAFEQHPLGDTSTVVFVFLFLGRYCIHLLSMLLD